MENTNNLVKVLSSVLTQHDNNNLNILFNVFSYLILKKMVGNTFSLHLYNSIYDSSSLTSFISIMKSKYGLEVIKLDPCYIEKIINNQDNDINNDHMINIYDIITTLNLKNLQYNQNNFNYINHTINIIKSSINQKSSMLLMSSNFGEFNNILNMSNSIEVFDISKENTILSQMEYDYNHHNIDPKGQINNSKIIFKCEDYIHNNIINKSYDIIMCNFPAGLRNIIHADCCDKIKRLKIRGTKSEPLILQLIMMSLNINGKASLLVPNTLLNNDSKQHVETRNHLINNFNVTDIITCDNNLSILYFEKTGLTKQTTFSKIQDNKIVKLFDVFYDKIVKRNYNLYYEKYINIDCNILSTICNNKKTLNDIVDIVEYIDNINYNISSNYLRIPKFLSNDTQKVEIICDNCELNCDDMSLMVKDTNIINQKYFNYYFLHILSPHLITSTIGKSKKIDINTLLTNEISIPSIMNQNKIVEFYDINYSLINQIKKQIETVHILKYNYIETICNNYPMIKIKDLCDVDVKQICSNNIL